MLDLIRSGVINGTRKVTDPGKVVAAFLLGSTELYDFVDHNKDVLMRDISYTNDPWVIARNPGVVSINFATEVDLTGQICADSIGTRIYSGTGGQLDFVKGARRSEGGPGKGRTRSFRSWPAVRGSSPRGRMRNGS